MGPRRRSARILDQVYPRPHTDFPFHIHHILTCYPESAGFFDKATLLSLALVSKDNADAVREVLYRRICLSFARPEQITQLLITLAVRAPDLSQLIRHIVVRDPLVLHVDKSVAPPFEMRGLIDNAVTKLLGKGAHTLTQHQWSHAINDPKTLSGQTAYIISVAHNLISLNYSAKDSDRHLESTIFDLVAKCQPPSNPCLSELRQLDLNSRDARRVLVLPTFERVKLKGAKGVEFSLPLTVKQPAVWALHILYLRHVSCRIQSLVDLLSSGCFIHLKHLRLSLLRWWGGPGEQQKLITLLPTACSNLENFEWDLCVRITEPEQHLRYTCLGFDTLKSLRSMSRLKSLTLHRVLVFHFAEHNVVCPDLTSFLPKQLEQLRLTGVQVTTLHSLVSMYKSTCPLTHLLGTPLISLNKLIMSIDISGNAIGDLKSYQEDNRGVLIRMKADASRNGLDFQFHGHQRYSVGELAANKISL